MFTKYQGCGTKRLVANNDNEVVRVDLETVNLKTIICLWKISLD